MPTPLALVAPMRDAHAAPTPWRVMPTPRRWRRPFTHSAIAPRAAVTSRCRLTSGGALLVHNRGMGENRGKGGGGKGGGGRGRGGGRKGGREESTEPSAPSTTPPSQPPSQRGAKGAQSEAGAALAASSSVPEAERDGFLELAKQLADLARLETQSHDALAKRITDLESALQGARKELADVRIRNERLEKQLKAASTAAEAAGSVLASPAPPKPASPAAQNEGRKRGASAADEAPAAAPARAAEDEDDDDDDAYQEAEEDGAGEEEGGRQGDGALPTSAVAAAAAR